MDWRGDRQIALHFPGDWSLQRRENAVGNRLLEHLGFVQRHFGPQLERGHANSRVLRMLNSSPGSDCNQPGVECGSCRI